MLRGDSELQRRHDFAWRGRDKVAELPGQFVRLLNWVDHYALHDCRADRMQSEPEGCDDAEYTCLLLNPDGSTWAFDNGGEPDPTASLTGFGTQLGDQHRHELGYPRAQAFTAAWLSTTDVLAIGNNGFRVGSLPTGEETRAHEAPQTNPMGVVHLGDGVVLTAGNSVTLAVTETRTWEHHEIAMVAVIVRVPEKAMAQFLARRAASVCAVLLSGSGLLVELQQVR